MRRDGMGRYVTVDGLCDGMTVPQYGMDYHSMGLHDAYRMSQGVYV